MNYLLPAKGVMPMHCSINVGAKGDAAIFFWSVGHRQDLPPLSADPNRPLVGDVVNMAGRINRSSNFEGGCYAKMIRLSAEAEPGIECRDQDVFWHCAGKCGD